MAALAAISKKKISFPVWRQRFLRFLLIKGSFLFRFFLLFSQKLFSRVLEVSFGQEKTSRYIQISEMREANNAWQIPKYLYTWQSGQESQVYY